MVLACLLVKAIHLMINGSRLITHFAIQQHKCKNMSILCCKIACASHDVLNLFMSLQYIFFFKPEYQLFDTNIVLIKNKQFFHNFILKHSQKNQMNFQAKKILPLLEKRIKSLRADDGKQVVGFSFKEYENTMLLSALSANGKSIEEVVKMLDNQISIEEKEQAQNQKLCTNLSILLEDINKNVNKYFASFSEKLLKVAQTQVILFLEDFENGIYLDDKTFKNKLGEIIQYLAESVGSSEKCSKQKKVELAIEYLTLKTRDFFDDMSSKLSWFVEAKEPLDASKDCNMKLEQSLYTSDENLTLDLRSLTNNQISKYSNDILQSKFAKKFDLVTINTIGSCLKFDSIAKKLFSLSGSAKLIFGSDDMVIYPNDSVEQQSNKIWKSVYFLKQKVYSEIESGRDRFVDFASMPSLGFNESYFTKFAARQNAVNGFHILSAFATITNLQHFIFDYDYVLNCNPTSDVINALAKVVKNNPNLIVLSFDFLRSKYRYEEEGSFSEDFLAQMGDALGECPRITSFTFCTCQDLNDSEKIKPFNNQLAALKLEHLTFVCNLCSDEFYFDLCQSIKVQKSMTTLIFAIQDEYATITGQEISEAVRCLENLNGLSLLFNNFSIIGSCLMRAILTCKNIKHLVLSGMSESDEEAPQALIEILKSFQSLHTLHLFDTRNIYFYSENFVSDFKCSINQMKKLQHFTFGLVNIFEDTGADFTLLTKELCQLKSFKATPWFDCSGYTLVKPLSILTELQHFTLVIDSSLTIDPQSYIKGVAEGLMNNTSLLSLKLVINQEYSDENCLFGDGDMQLIAEMVKKKVFLQDFILQAKCKCDLTANGLNCLLNSLEQCKHLQTFTLYTSPKKVTGDWLERLGEFAKNNHKLKTLYFGVSSETVADEVGYKHFVKLFQGIGCKLENLGILLSNTSVTDAEIHAMVGGFCDTALRTLYLLIEAPGLDVEMMYKFKSICPHCCFSDYQRMLINIYELKIALDHTKIITKNLQKCQITIISAKILNFLAAVFVLLLFLLDLFM